MKTVLLASVVVILIGGVFWYMFQYRGNTSETSVTDGHLHSIYLVNPGGPAYKQYFDKVESSLRELHHKNGTSLQMYTKNAEGNPQKLATMVTEAVQAKPNLIITISSQPTQQALAESNGEIPILSTLGDPIEHGYVDSLKGSGKNLGGVAQQNIALTPKRLELLKELAPSVKKVAVFYDTTCGPTKKARPIANAFAPEIGLELFEIALTNPTRAELEDALNTVTRENYDALIFYPHGTLFSKADLFLKRAREEGLVIIMPNEEALAEGALASYGPSYAGMGELIARLSEKILTDNISVSVLPWEQPSVIDYFVSLENAEKLGLTIDPAMASRATLVR